MQQVCNNCGTPIQPGSITCARCGAPVTSGAPGAYDPTVRAGAPPGSGYGQQPYGAPPMSDPYGAPPPQQGFGGPPPQQGWGAPPPQQGFGPPPQPGYGQPMAPMMAPQKKSNAPLIVGIIALVLIVCVGGGIAAAVIIGHAATKAVDTAATAVATLGTTIPTSSGHFTNVQIGAGDDTGAIQTQKTDFTQNDTIVITFTATTQDSNASALLKVTSDGQDIGTNGPLSLDTGKHDYYFAFQITGSGNYTAELQYNGTTEQTVDFTVS